MRSTDRPRLFRISAAAAFIVLTGAAAPIDRSISPLMPQAGMSEGAVVAKTVTASNASFQAAPVPDQDVNAPADSTRPDTTISPKFLSTKTLFQGDGYSYGSSEQATLDNRRAGAAGLGLSVPVK